MNAVKVAGNDGGNAIITLHSTLRSFAVTNGESPSHLCIWSELLHPRLSSRHVVWCGVRYNTEVKGASHLSQSESQRRARGERTSLVS